MTRHVHYDDAWRTPEEVAKLKAEKARHPARADFDFPAVMSDIGEYQSQVDGSMITSRSQHREHLRKHNCVEVGSEMPTFVRPPVVPLREEIASDIKESIAQLEAGYVPPEGPPSGTHVGSDGLVTEHPDFEPIDARNVKDGEYIRSSNKADERVLVIPAA